MRLRRVDVAAIEDRAVQLMWGHAPPGEICVAAAREDGRGEAAPSVSMSHGGGPGGVILDGLRPSTRYRFTVSVGGGRPAMTIAATTLVSPPGEELCRIATISDTHIGSLHHGLLKTMIDRGDHPDPAPIRCARGAVREAVGWGTDLLVAKGDLTQHGWREEWHALGAMLTAHGNGLDMVGIAGNHDHTPVRDIDPHHGLDLAGLGAGAGAGAGAGHAGPRVADLPGVRVIAVDSTVEGRNPGGLGPRAADVLDAAADAAAAGLAVLVCLHHPLERLPFPTKYPMGLRWPESASFGRALGRANGRAVIVAGHSHRNRRSDRGNVVHCEVGSTKDWPGVWGGYVVHEGGIRQVVRRIMAPDALGWIEYSRLAVGGVWRFYAPGRLAARCFTHAWT